MYPSLQDNGTRWHFPRGAQRAADICHNPEQVDKVVDLLDLLSVIPKV